MPGEQLTISEDAGQEHRSESREGNRDSGAVRGAAATTRCCVRQLLLPFCERAERAQALLEEMEKPEAAKEKMNPYAMARALLAIQKLDPPVQENRPVSRDPLSAIHALILFIRCERSGKPVCMATLLKHAADGSIQTGTTGEEKREKQEAAGRAYDCETFPTLDALHLAELLEYLALPLQEERDSRTMCMRRRRAFNALIEAFNNVRLDFHLSMQDTAYWREILPLLADGKAASLRQAADMPRTRVLLNGLKRALPQEKGITRRSLPSPDQSDDSSPPHTPAAATGQWVL